MLPKNFMGTNEVLIPNAHVNFSQCFGMYLQESVVQLTVNWNHHRLSEACGAGKGSVPRGRVYAAYVSQCAGVRIAVLNPASFGKLVRVLFPGLKTRRLGIRGESKYHYVDFLLLGDQPMEDEAESVPSKAVPQQHEHSSQR